MEALVNLIVSLWNELFPWVKIEPWERGVRTTFGRHPKELGPGVRWALPFMHTVEVENVMAQPLDLSEQTFGETVVSGRLQYRISDLCLLYCSVVAEGREDYEEYLGNDACSLVGEYMTDEDDPTPEDLVEFVTGQLPEMCEQYGIQLIRYVLADYTVAGVHRVFGGLGQ